MAEQTAIEDTSSLPEWIAIFVENPGTALAALLGAVGIWFYVKGRIEDTRKIPAVPSFDVREGFVITKIVDHEGNRVTLQPSRSEVDLTIRGPISTLERLKNERLQIVKRMPTPEGEKTREVFNIQISEADLKLPHGELPLGVHLKPRTLEMTVTVEEVLEKTQNVLKPTLEENINFLTRGAPRSDFKISNISSNLSSVTIRGPGSALEDLNMVPENPIDVNNKASTVTRQISLTTRPPNEYVAIDPEEVTITVEITSKMTQITVQDQFSISMDPSLHKIFENRGWNFQPENRSIEITFNVPKNMEEGKLQAKNIHPVLILPQPEIEAIKKPKASYIVNARENLWVLLDRNLPNRNKIEVIKIEPETIKFKPKE